MELQLLRQEWNTYYIKLIQLHTQHTVYLRSKIGLCMEFLIL